MTTTTKIPREQAEAALAALTTAWAPSLTPRDMSGHPFEPLTGGALEEHLIDAHMYDRPHLARKTERGKTLAEIHEADHKPEALYPTGPVLVEDWNGEGWAISWEEGPDEWAMLHSGGGTSESDRVMFAAASEEFGADMKPPTYPKVEWPKGVYVEAYYSFVVTLHPA